MNRQRFVGAVDWRHARKCSTVLEDQLVHDGHWNDPAARAAHRCALAPSSLASSIWVQGRPITSPRQYEPGRAGLPSEDEECEDAERVVDKRLQDE